MLRCALLLLCALLAFSQTAPLYVVTTVAGRGKLPYAGDGRQATTVNLFDAHRLAFDRAGNLYFTEDYYQRVFRVSREGVLTVFAGNGEHGTSGDGGPATAAGFDTVAGLAVDLQGNVYVGDTDCIRRIGTSGIIQTFAGKGEHDYTGDGGPAGAARFHTPEFLTVDAAGNLYFVDENFHVVRRIGTDGIITTVAGTGTPGYSGDGGPARLARLNSPRAVAVDAIRNVYIADTANQRIRRVAPDGIITTVAGNGEFGFSGDTGPATAARLFNPYGIALDGDRLLICDGTNGRVRYLAPDGRIFALSREVGAPLDIAVSPSGFYAAIDFLRNDIWRMQPNGSAAVMAGLFRSTGLGDGDSAGNAALLTPRGLALDGEANLYVADRDDQRVRRVDAATGVITTFAGTGLFGYSNDGSAPRYADLAQPTGLAADPGGAIHITCNNSIRTVRSGVIRTFVGGGDAGYGGDNSLATVARINFPFGLATDAAGNLYIADTFNHRIRRVTPNSTITTVAGNGEQGFSGNGGGPLSARLDTPSAVAVDAAQNIYIADSGNHRVRKVSPSGVIADFAGNGQQGSSGDGGPATRAAVEFPVAVALDGAGGVLIATSGLVRRVGPDGIIQTIAGTGDWQFLGDGDVATLAGMDPMGLAVDREGRIYVSDAANRRIRRLDPARIYPSGVLNAASHQPGPVAPGEMLVFKGADLGPAGILRGSPDASGALPIVLGEARVDFDGLPAPLFAVSANEVIAAAPYALAGKTSVAVQSSWRGSKSNTIRLPVAEARPALFTVSAVGQGQASASNEDGTPNSAANPAPRGSLVYLVATGTGQTDPPGADGQVAGEPLPVPVLPLAVTIGDVEAEIVSATAAGGQPAGIVQITVRIPEGASAGDAVPVRLKAGQALSPTGVTLAVAQ